MVWRNAIFLALIRRHKLKNVEYIFRANNYFFFFKHIFNLLCSNAKNVKNDKYQKNLVNEQVAPFQ